MKKKFYLNDFLFQLLNFTIKPAIGKMLIVSVETFRGFRGVVFNFNKQTSFERALPNAPVPVLYNVFNPLTAAWFT